MDPDEENVSLEQLRGPAQLTPPLQHHPQDSPSQQQQPPMPLQKQPIQPTQRPPTPVAPDDRPPEPPRPEPPIRPSTDQAISVPPPRGVSLPPVVEGGARRPPARPLAYSQSERVGGARGVASEVPPLERSVSRRGEAIKRYIRKETANFFGVGEEEESGEQQLRWLDRRKRMACRTMGPLKDEYCTPTISRFSQHRRTVSEAGPGRGAGPSSREAGQLATGRPDVLPGDSPDSTTGRVLPAAAEAGTSLRRKDSVARMTWDGLSYVVTTLSRHRPRPRSQQSQWSRSFHSPETPELPATAAEEQSFFERPPSVPASPPEGDTVDRARVVEPVRRERDRVRYAVPVTRGWRREEEEEDDVVLRRAGGSRKLSNWLDRVLDNSDRRQYGMGWVGKMFGRSIRKSVTQDSTIQEQLDDMEDHRPMFTYWVTTVQILVLFISIVCYGFGPFGLDLQARSGQVLVTSLSLQQVDYMEPANFWFGPRAGDLIHLGAKFAPCMRIDNKIKKEIDKIQAKERETACCIRNDDSGCVQSSQADCSKTISTWKKWTMGDAGPGGRISGSVCGLDPKFCDAPASVHPYEWPDDITKWPICRKTNTQFSKSNTQFSVQKGGSGNSAAGPRDKLAEHMVCEIIGHPCCIGIHGQCRITTKEYCDFVRGGLSRGSFSLLAGVLLERRVRHAALLLPRLP
ncbi:unnamed protein product [Phaedon cochleariae]|uniref:Inactive rhomboid protein 1 n=1 Tax=Phaedon cochleariae TaxID=80249 RepID=A0A9P0DPN8_PHACE|nr:unnamed protein product [Phaedon cochleariae]